VLSGLYPAFYLSHWAPLTALTGKQVAGKGSLRLREGLVLLQFTISAAVIACTLLMASQMRYVANKSLGFEKENRLVVTLRGLSTIEKASTIKTELGKTAGILGISEADIMMGQQGPINLGQVENLSGAMEPMQLSHMPIGDNFVDVMGLKLLEGRDFSTRLLTDVGTNFLVNQAFVRKMGWENAIGKRIQLGPQNGRVIGVVQDFNFKSLHTVIEPFAMYPMRSDFSGIAPMNRPFITRLLVLNVSGDNVGDSLGAVEDIVRKADPAHPFEYQFLDASLDQLYKSEQQLMNLIGIFATVCIFIACLGLFGLSSFATEQRTREIGTRKVLGATTLQIILMLAKGIMMLVVVASVIASVLAYFAIDEWLAGFAYRAGINPLIFLLSAAAAALVAFGTVAMQSFKTARADPVQALRHV
jgi:putative ABC transport system permease protein